MRVIAPFVASALWFSGDAVRERRKAKALPEAYLFPGAIDIVRPAFIYEDKDTNEFVVSQFGRRAKLGDWNLNPFPAPSAISRLSVEGVGRALNSTGLSKSSGSQKKWISRGLQWPNILSKTPKELGDYTVIPDGFLPPGKENGGMFLANAEGQIHRCVPYLKGAFYHEVEWHDMNGDGLKDMVTSRVIKGKDGLFKFTFDGEMLWYANPGLDKMFNTVWEEHLITKGPDVVFRITDHKDGMAIYATEFFSDTPRIVINFVDKNGVLQKQKTVDDNMGSPFGLELVDLNGDGKLDLLATNHQDDEDVVKASVYAYEIPDDIETGTFKRHTIADWPAKLSDDRVGSGSPGFAVGFYPRIGQTSGPKHVICAGDGSWDIWYLRPTGNFQYDTQVLPINGTTGQLILGDYSGDGIMDVLIPDNDNWKIYGLTFKGV